MKIATRRGWRLPDGLYRIGIPLLMVLGAFFLFASLPGEEASALSMPKNLSEARSRLRALCNAGNAVAHAGYTSNVKLNTSNGRVTYDLNIIWRSCGGAVTRYYAITGYPSAGGLTVCNNVGTYSAPQTHDCVKYSGNPPHASFGSPSRPGSRVNGNFWGGARAGVYTNYPPTSQQSKKVSLTGQVPNWSTRGKSTGSATLGASNVLCSYYIQGSVDRGGRMCQDVYVTVSWVVPVYNLTPSITTLPVAVEPGQSVAIGGHVAKTGDINTTSPTDTRYTRIIRKVGQSAPRLTTGTGTSAACAFYGMTGSNASRCSQIGSSMGSTFNNYRFTGSGRSMTAMTDTVPEDFNPGDQICYGLSVRGYNQSNGPSKSSARHSALRCVIVGKKPKVHVTGGDLYVGRGSSSGTVSTSVSMTGRSEVTPPSEDIEAQVRATQGLWYFGYRAGLNFGTAGSGAPSPVRTARAIQGLEGTTVAIDEKGKLQFFTDGLNVYRENGALMPSGSGIGSTSTTTQAAASFPLSGNRYAIIVTSSNSSDSGSPALGRLYYSIVDMNANDTDGVKGRVTVKRQPFGPAGNVIGEALSVIPSYNSSGSEGSAGYWIVTNEVGTNRVRAHKVSYSWNGSNGTAATFNPVVSATGATSGDGVRGFGAINFAKFNTMNDRNVSAVLAMSATSPPSSAYRTDSVRVLNFDRQTGQFQERLNWRLGQRVYTADFSPDGSYVYVTSLYNGSNNYGNLYRYKISGASTRAQVEASVHKIADAAGGTGLRSCDSASPNNGGGHVKRGPDNKMYVANWGCGAIGVVSDPNNPSNSSIRWNAGGRSLASGATSRYGLPQMAVAPAMNMGPNYYARTVYGSWSEYGIAASGQVNRMASAAGYAGGIYQEGVSLAGVTLCSVSFLSFANQNNADTCGESTVGHYSLPANVRTIIDRYASSGSASHFSSSVSPGSLSAGVNTPSGEGAITLSGGTMPIGKWAVLYAPNSDVVINGDVRYASGAMNGIGQIPQLVIIARNITINESVTQVDAWLVAKTTGHGNIYTCNRGTASITASRCSQQLTVNGPVISNKLHLRRTAGAGRDSDGPRAAEVFNLRPDAYFWGVAQDTASGSIPTVMITELPPRF